METVEDLDQAPQSTTTPRSSREMQRAALRSELAVVRTLTDELETLLSSERAVDARGQLAEELLRLGCDILEFVRTMPPLNVKRPPPG